jgi:hypothetical protein
MSLSVDPIAPYAALAKTIAGAVALMLLTGLLFMGGWALGRHQMDKKLDAAHAALRNAATSLHAASDALTTVNTEARRRIDQAKADKDAADKAAIAAQAAQHDAEARLAKLQQAELRARKRPGCAALLDADLLKVCGL